MRNPRDLLDWITSRPVHALRRALQVLVLEPPRYRQPGGYDAERYWRDRLVRHGLSLRGAGREGWSEADNVADYGRAAETFLAFCRDERIELAGATVMDVGCGPGFYAALCQSRGVRSYLGVDITDVLFPRLAQAFPSYRFVQRDAGAEELEGTYDVVLMIDVVEHIVEEQKLEFAMRNVDRCLVSGGVFVIALPSPVHWPKRLFHVRRWLVSDITSRFPCYAPGRMTPFRDGNILVLRKPSANG